MRSTGEPPPLVDVLVPVFNCEATVASAIASIQRQTVSNIRIVVVNDGSTDRTGAVVENLAREDSRICLLDKPNSGIVDALNLGLAQCRAEFVARHDGDDLADPVRFERQLLYLETHADCIAVSCHARLIDEHGHPTGDYSRPGPAHLSDPHRPPAREPYLLHPYLIARRDALERIGGYRHVYLAEDSDLYWRLEEIGALHNMVEVLGDYRVHGGSVTSASIRRGRMNALFSELAALSATRRRASRPDLDFTPALVSKIGALHTLAEMHSEASKLLTTPESDWLRVAISLKLIELTFTRRYQLEADDCRFIRAAVDDGWLSLTPTQRFGAAELIVQGCKSLLRSGSVRLLFVLTPLRLYPKVAARIAFRWLVPIGVQDYVKRRVA